MLATQKNIVTMKIVMFLQEINCLQQNTGNDKSHTSRFKIVGVHF